MPDLSADVVVIGAGPTGGAAAWRLASYGIDVLVIEAGDWLDPEALARDAPDWERRRASNLNANPNVRRGPADYPIDDRDSPIKPMIGNAVGGGSLWWAAHVPRFRPEDFRVRSLDRVGENWPLKYDDLAPYYRLNEEQLGLAAVPGDPSSAPHGERALPLPTIGAHGRRLAKAFDRLGWHWWPVDLAVGRDAEAPGAEHCTHLGPCDLGCPSRLRAGADRAYVGEAIRLGARLMTGKRVLRLEHDRDDRVTAAICRNEDGDFRVHGKTFVLAANGIGTPRLLLLSASGRFPKGVANSSGLVGRNLMLHPYARVDALFPDALGSWGRGEKAGIVSFEFYPTKPEHGFVRGCKLQIVPGPSPAALANGAVTGQPLQWGEGHHQAFAARFDHICGLTVCAEDLPEPDNAITLSSDLADRDGLPAPKMTYRLSANTRNILDFGMDRAEEVLRGAGAVQTFRTALQVQSGFHLMGTARMGENPETSVTDRWGRCHDVRNLFIADASVFVTGSAANPTNTAQALALRMADGILAERAA